MIRAFILILSVVSTFQLSAQYHSENSAPIVFIYDASGSMWGQIQGKSKMNIAAGVLSTTINRLPDNQKIGLVVYGHRKKGDCKDVEFVVSLKNGTKSMVNKAIKGIKPPRKDTSGVFCKTRHR